ncbi:MAG TPA: hypothetical protein ENI23_02060 [bacterium]|nr:hypothetical protein [bacterium]
MRLPSWLRFWFTRKIPEGEHSKFLAPGLQKEFELAYKSRSMMSNIEVAEGRIEIQMKYNGIVYGNGLKLEDHPKWEDLAREMRVLSHSLMETLRENHYFAEIFMMDGCKHRRGDPDCCGRGEICNELTYNSNITCSGIMHYQPVYGGFYYECDRCGRTK